MEIKLRTARRPGGHLQSCSFQNLLEAMPVSDGSWRRLKKNKIYVLLTQSGSFFDPFLENSMENRPILRTTAYKGLIRRLVGSSTIMLLILTAHSVAYVRVRAKCFYWNVSPLKGLRSVFLRLQIAAQLSRARYLFALSYWKGRPRKKTRNGDDIVNLLWVLSLACN